MDSTVLGFILNLAGAAALLIWAVRLVRTGFQRAFGGHLRLWLRRSTSNRLAAACCGASAAILMQSSTAVAMLMAGFVAAGTMGGVAGLAVFLGADFGSAIVALILNSSVDVLKPALMLAGVLIFLRSTRRQLRQIGRILIGLALIFLSLDLIRAASQPLVDGDGTQALMGYLVDDPLTAFVIAAVFAWLVHSSVAAVLLFTTFAAQGVLPLYAAFAMVLGANLGGTAIAIVLTLKSEATVRQVVWANAVLRGGGACLLLFVLSVYSLPPNLLGTEPATQVLNLHLLFNGFLLVLFLPFVKPIMRAAEILLPAQTGDAQEVSEHTLLDFDLLDRPKHAFAASLRELVAMANRVETMLRRSMLLFEQYDEAVAGDIAADFKRVERMSLDLRLYLASVRAQDSNDAVLSRAIDLSGIAMNLEAGGELISRKLLSLAQRRDRDQLQFSEEGWRELSDFHDSVLRNVQHGMSVLMSEDVGLARELVEQKELVRSVSHSLEKRHLERLRQGVSESIDTSSMHLDVLRTLKSLNTSFAMIAYPILKESGELLDSRLAEGDVAETQPGR